MYICTSELWTMSATIDTWVLSLSTISIISNSDLRHIDFIKQSYLLRIFSISTIRASSIHHLSNTLPFIAILSDNIATSPLTVAKAIRRRVLII